MTRAHPGGGRIGEEVQKAAARRHWRPSRRGPGAAAERRATAVTRRGEGFDGTRADVVRVDRAGIEPATYRFSVRRIMDAQDIVIKRFATRVCHVSASVISQTLPRFLTISNAFSDTVRVWNGEASGSF